ncbi:MAG TPA: DUF4432 family protein [Bryobacteraceae bacterium]|nr:DUF4432 family protein [Bryobacteraceae bacterium]
MAETNYLGRRAHSLANEHLEVIVTVEGGHIASIRDKATGVNPLWVPPWKSIEPSTYDEAKHPEYGCNSESQLLAGILGHNLCLDQFGGPSEAEAAAGIGVHGEGSVAHYKIEVDGDVLTQQTLLETCQLKFTRRIRLAPDSRRLEIAETVENCSPCDRPVAWTQHVTLGPPFLEKGLTRFESTATKSKTMEADFTGGFGHMAINTKFDWPLVPLVDGGVEDLRVFTSRAKSGAFSTHLMDPAREDAWFAAWSPTHKLAIAYIWRRADFPWLGIWEENLGRVAPPWNGRSITRGMEFGASPFPESRRAMIERGPTFQAPGYRWIPARTAVTAEYAAVVAPAASLGEMTSLAGS